MNEYLELIVDNICQGMTLDQAEKAAKQKMKGDK